MKNIILGRDHEGRTVEVDLELLLRTRLLLQANSGGGKSRTLRRIAEQLFGKVQVIIIDREGEFASLREKYGYLWVGRRSDGADADVDVRSARLMAERLLELRASAVCDLFEAFRARPLDRRAWLADFLEALLDAPRSMWRDLVIIVDEAHQFCPQENPKAASMVEREIISRCKEQMVALATVGRKRGYCAIWATQRLAKLDKDATAELFNRMIGMTIEDVDVDRAVELMSVSREDRHEFKETLRELTPGNFFVFGRALSKTRVLIKVGDVQTSHPEPGAQKQIHGPPPVPEKIRHLLPRLEDLPKEAETKAKTEKELQGEIKRLQSELVKAKAARPVLPAPVKPAAPAAPIVRTKTEIVNVEVPVIRQAEMKRLESILGRAEGLMAKASELGKPFEMAAKDLRTTIAGVVSAAARSMQAAKAQIPTIKPAPAPVPKPVQALARPAKAAPSPSSSDQAEEDFRPSKSHLAILQAILEFQSIGIEAPSRNQITGWLGIKVTGTFRTNLSDLRTTGYIDYRGKGVIVTERGAAASPAPEVEPTTDGILSRALKAFSSSEGEMLKAVHRIHPEWMTREDLAETCGVKITGTFRTNLSTLHVAEVIDYGEDEKKNHVKCADWMFIGQPASV